jgi:hypothetical protein
VEKLRAEGGDAVVTIGSRQRGAQIDVQQNAARRLLGRLGNYYIRAVAVPGVRDTQCGFKLLRGEAARTLLARGTALAEAAAASGFADQSHMTRLFVRAYGLTPGAYVAALA